MELNKIFSQRRQLIPIVLISFFSFVLFSACSEYPLKIASGTLPNDELLNVTVDTLPVELFTVGTDAVETQSLTTTLLGSVNDTVMGDLETEFLADYIYTDEPTFRDQLDLDSVQVLDMVIDLLYSADNVYGKAINLDFDVYELLEPMPQYSKSDYVVLPHMYDPTPISVDHWFQANTYEAINAIDVVDTCHVILKNSFAQQFLDTNLIKEDIYYSENQRQFKEHFKGFYFAVKPRPTEGGGIIMIDQTAINMTLRTIEWNTDEAKWDTISNVFSIGNPSSEIDSGGMHLNLYRNTLSANVARTLNDTLHLFGNAYIQSLTGPQVFVKLPTLPALRDEFGNSISVNEAQLILPVNMERFMRDRGLYTPPYRLGLLDGKTKDPLLDDRLAENHIWGYRDSTSLGEIQYYWLNLENQLNDYIRDEASTASNTFFLFAASSDTKNTVQYLNDRPTRLVLNGSTSSNPPFLRIVYSKP
jgi:hypothetical protein